LEDVEREAGNVGERLKFWGWGYESDGFKGTISLDLKGLDQLLEAEDEVSRAARFQAGILGLDLEKASDAIINTGGTITPTTPSAAITCPGSNSTTVTLLPSAWRRQADARTARDHDPGVTPGVIVPVGG